MKNSEKSIFMAMIVKLYYIDHKGQNEIAKLTGISQAKVSRLLSEAREIGMVQVKVGHYEPRNRELETQITQTFGLQQTVVIRTWKKQQKDLHYKNIGYFAAPIITEMIQPNSTVCIAAGRHISHLINEMTPPNIPGVSVIQTMGSVGPSVTDHDAIELSRRFATIINGRFYQLQAPAIATSSAERDIFMKHPQIQTVLDMMKDVKLAIVGVGTPQDSVFIENNIIKGEDIATLERQNVVGEICGRFYDIDGNPAKTKYRDCVIGITLEQLRHIPKVVGITSGIHRIRAITGALNAGVIKILVIDEETAEALIANYQSSPKAKND